MPLSLSFCIPRAIKPAPRAHHIAVFGITIIDPTLLYTDQSLQVLLCLASPIVIPALTFLPIAPPASSSGSSSDRGIANFSRPFHLELGRYDISLRLVGVFCI